MIAAEHGELTKASKIRKQLPVEDYLKPQRRFGLIDAAPVGAVASASTGAGDN